MDMNENKRLYRRRADGYEEIRDEDAANEEMEVLSCDYAIIKRQMMKNVIVNAAAGLVALCGLILLTGDTPNANAATFMAVKICGGALLWVAYKALERVHPEWEEEEV